MYRSRSTGSKVTVDKNGIPILPDNIIIDWEKVNEAINDPKAPISDLKIVIRMEDIQKSCDEEFVKCMALVPQRDKIRPRRQS